MLNKFFKIFLFTLYLVVQPIFTKAPVNKSSLAPVSLPLTTKLPKGERVNIKIKAPDDYKDLPKIEDTDGSALYRYIPENDKDPKGSESYSVNVFTLKSSPAGTAIEDHINKIRTNVANLKISDFSKESHLEYEKVSVVLHFERKWRSEIAMIYAFSGDKGTVVVSYSIVLDNGVTEEDAMKKLGDFMDDYSNISISKY